MTKHSLAPNNSADSQFSDDRWQVALPAIQSQWAELIATLGLNPSLHPEWVSAIVESFSKADCTRILSEKAGPDLRGLISYFRETSRVAGIPFNTTQLTSNLVSYHPELVCIADHSGLLRRLLDETKGWHVLHVANLMPDGPTARALEELARETGSRLLTYKIDSSPYLTISSSWDEFFASKNKKFRYKHRQRKKSLTEDGRLDMRWYCAADNVEQLLSAILAIELKSWKADKGVDISGNSIETNYYKSLLAFLASKECLLANVLYINSTPVAYNLCCNWEGWVGQLKTSFDPQFRDLSPGSIVIDAAIEKSFEIGAREFDFLGHADQHKLSWSTTTRVHFDYFLYSQAFRARLLGAVRAFKNRRRD